MRVPEEPVCIDLFRQNPVFTSLRLKSPVHVHRLSFTSLHLKSPVHVVPSLCTAVLIGWDPGTPLLPRHLGSYTRALLVS
jgi:hypothetical protein